MPRPFPHLTPIRVCEHCRQGIERRRWPSGKIETPKDYAARKFCSVKCKTMRLLGVPIEVEMWRL